MDSSYVARDQRRYAIYAGQDPDNPDENVQRILDWCRSVPSREDREDPFADVRVTAVTTPTQPTEEEHDETTVVEYPPDLPPRPPARLSFFRSPTPRFGSSEAASQQVRPASRSTLHAPALSSKVLGLFSRKRKQRSPSPPPAPPSPPQPMRLHFLFVGGRGCGQTSLLFRSRFGYCPDVMTTTFPSLGSGPQANHVRNDTSGAPDLNTVERLTYMPWHCVFLCFDVRNKISMLTIVQWWIHARSRGFNRQTQGFEPLVDLVGMKMDLRDECRRGTSCPGGDICNSCCISRSDIRANAHSIRASRCIEVSAKTGEGIHELLEDSAAEATRRVLIRQASATAPSKRRRA
ncbi:hypothetical protein HIM_07910 [Hirsutella minnesotensis 3608]|uniref:Uncharacterized protein n=1 Tax=Hirsutella minnesotensis 3608 TaxID=1043627 RepID=A0A0F7ZT94_9HYPO|nr:hypothetical protein HIM_07910 [Hirsutella minnesotensis 3608]